MQLTPLIAVHMTAAIGAVVIGPFALWARMGSTQRPWLHRAMGYAYATLMLLAATTACFIRDFNLPNFKRLCHPPHHHAVPVCRRLSDCWRFHPPALTLFGKFDLA